MPADAPRRNWLPSWLGGRPALTSSPFSAAQEARIRDICRGEALARARQDALDVAAALGVCPDDVALTPLPPDEMRRMFGRRAGDIEGGG